MAYDTALVDKVREYLAKFHQLDIEEKRMFGGFAFLVNGKMCVNVSDQNLMCRFDPDRTEELAERIGFLPMVMRGKELKGYCYVEPVGIKRKEDFEFWLNLCLDFNDDAKISKKRRNG